MKIFNNAEGEIARFERHMKPIRAMQENQRLKQERAKLKMELLRKRKQLRALKITEQILRQELKPLQLELPLKRPL